MKVFNQVFVKFHNYQTNQSDCKREYKPYYNHSRLESDIVSFGHKPRIEGDSSNHSGINVNLDTIKNIVDLPCIYCGKPMLTQSEKNRMAAQISKAKGVDLVKALDSSKKYLRGVKKDIAEKISRVAYKYPDENIQEILLRLAPESKAELESIQADVLRRIAGKYSDSFETEEEKHVFELLIYEGMQWIINEDESEPFKRKSFLYEVKRVLSLPIFRNQKLAHRVIKEFEKLPQSRENESAFIVKYQRRSPREIAEMLFYEPTATLEHIRPKSVKGPTSPENLAVACAYCNNYVRNNIPLTRFVQMHPEIEINIQRNFDKILQEGRKIRQTALKKLQTLDIQSEKGLKYLQRIKDEDEYLKYIEALALTFESESEGKLNLDKYIGAH